jgi:TetR/AcrR family transcriptional regulator
MTGPSSPEGRRQQRRLRHHDVNRNQLLDAGEQVFGEKGFHDTTLKEVAELAAFSVGSVYSYFDNKEDLFRQIFLRRGNEFMQHMRLVLESAVPPMQKLHGLVDFQVGFFREHRSFGQLFLRYVNLAMISDTTEIDAAIARNYAESMRLQSDLFLIGQRNGAFRKGDPKVLAHLFSGIIASYQAVDLAVIPDDLSENEPFALKDLHQLIERAFAASAASSWF